MLRAGGGVPRLLFQTAAKILPLNVEYFANGDGKRFLFREPLGESTAPITVGAQLDSWFALLRFRVISQCHYRRRYVKLKTRREGSIVVYRGGNGRAFVNSRHRQKTKGHLHPARRQPAYHRSGCGNAHSCRQETTMKDSTDYLAAPAASPAAHSACPQLHAIDGRLAERSQ